MNILVMMALEMEEEIVEIVVEETEEIVVEETEEIVVEEIVDQVEEIAALAMALAEEIVDQVEEIVVLAVTEEIVEVVVLAEEIAALEMALAEVKPEVKAITLMDSNILKILVVGVGLMVEAKREMMTLLGRLLAF
jgi:hypothetical protein